MVSGVFAIVNQKGGVGKTTTAINLATYLSEEGFKTLIVDLDPQANATTGVGLKSETIDATVYDLFVDEGRIKDVLYPTPFDNLQMIPSSKDLAGAEIEMVGLEDREFLLKNRLKPFMNHYDYIIMDCPPSLSLLTINALCCATRAIIPVQCEYFALEGIASLINTLTLVKENFNSELAIEGIVLTMYDQRTTLNRQVVENAKKFFKGMVFNTIIPRNIRLSEAPSHGMPISLYNPHSKGAQAYSALAKEVIGYETTTATR